MKILVTGATGYIGGRLVPQLLERGHEVRVMVRDPERVAGRPWASEVEVATADVTDLESLRAACDGMEGAYYLIHSMGSAQDFAELDRRAADNFVEAGSRLQKVVYLGGLLPDARDVSEHLGSRAEVGEILRSGLATVEIQAGPVIGSGSASFEMVRYLTERLPAMIAPRWILNPVQPVAVDDVLAYLVLAMERECEGVFPVGTQPLSFKEMMQVFASVRGLRRLIVPVPVLAPRLAALWVGLVTPIPNSLAVPLIEGVVHPVVGDTRKARETFPEIECTGYREAVALALEDTEARVVATRWSGALAGAPAYQTSLQEGLIREVRTIHARCAPEQVFGVVSSLGGDRGWMAWGWAWRLRGLMDRLIGGPGLRRGRRHPTELLQGDAVDFWRVETVQPPGLLLLRAEMRLPGTAWLQWEALPEEGGTRLVQTALFAPIGLGGTLYWYVLYPFHKFIFSQMVRAIAREAEATA